MKSYTRSKGFTLLEILITITIVGILLSLAIPSFADIMEKRRLTGLAEQISGHLQLIRVEAISRSQDTFFNVSSGANWVYGLSSRAGCDLTKLSPANSNACILVVEDGDANIDPGDGSVDTDDLVLNRFDSTEHGAMSLAISNFSSGGSEISFDSVRGISDSGDITITSARSGYQLMVKIGILGDVRICSPAGDLSYSAVDC